MASHAVAISMGSVRSTTIDLPWLRVSDVSFPPGAVLAPHTHDRPVFAIALAGGLDSRLPGRRLECDATCMWTEPAGERHSNEVGSDGARILAILPDDGHAEALETCEPLLDGIHHWRHRGVSDLGRRIAVEMRVRDAASRLAVEGLALEALALGLRTRTRDTWTRTPAWLERARDILHERRRDPLAILDVAREVGVPPARLARAFRAAFGMPLATYHRRLRLDWAAHQIERDDTPISAIALRAGFYDQAHFTRHFRRHTGRTPAEYRRLIR
jgi:AraC family transcriptional regulator